MLDLLKEYQASLIFTEDKLKKVQKQIRFYKKQRYLNPTGKEHLLMLQHDERILNAALRTINFTIEWLATGRQPGLMRGIERRAVYQREMKSERNVIHFKSYDQYSHDNPSSDEIEDDTYKSQIAKEIVASLTKRQREILELYSQGFTCEEIGQMLGITKQGVWKTIDACKKKIEGEGWVMS
ncbi:sigma factor-like helix-turn-helix DNA-binding protein [Lysinibacillus halotolerans]|uniref:RNA polymerase sigma factor 70 region 4 type 2 domain-containing protein n=1 Tax=Lysinibacillus halotolerans TaxID=1368476 RepID=A0A3M8H756_9BACI|nr:sigma factor-like helix-turn-helix DNA-binding protein [Lysinibacillus halotolerans]RNC98252.1 hypothetical protein EC501_11645 [Lysinibacillus halotolerans]